MPSYKKGDEVKIVGGSYVGHRAWINTKKKPTKQSQSLVIVIDNEEVVKTIRKKSFKLMSKCRKPSTATEELLANNPTVEKHMRTAARHVAMLGIQESKVASVLFAEMVTEYIEHLQDQGVNAKYYPVRLESGVYQSFFCDTN